MKTHRHVGFCQTQQWKDQSMNEALAWHRATGNLTSTNESAYKAGYEEGYRAALSTLKLHGCIHIDADK